MPATASSPSPTRWRRTERVRGAPEHPRRSRARPPARPRQGPAVGGHRRTRLDRGRRTGARHVLPARLDAGGGDEPRLRRRARRSNQAGGRAGGGARLSTLGAEVVEAYRAVERAAQEAAAPALHRLAARCPESARPRKREKSCRMSSRTVDVGWYILHTLPDSFLRPRAPRPARPTLGAPFLFVSRDR